MTASEATSLLVFGYGNESRGDDALGPLLVNRLKDQFGSNADDLKLAFLDDYQIQVEHVMDLQDRQAVILIDAAVDIDAPFQFYRLQARPETSYTTHGMTADTLLYQYQKVLQSEPPPVYMLAVRGYEFELGKGLSASAKENIDQALGFASSLLQNCDPVAWDQHCQLN